VDGISLADLLAKRTTGLMQPQMQPAIEKATRRQFPQGIAPYGTDALRLSFASLATQSRDLRFDMARVQNYRNFCNKLWNGARYVLMNVEGQDLKRDAAQFGLPDRWIRARLRATIERVQAGFAEYRLDVAAAALYEFTWNDFCDWYLELSKAVLQSEKSSEAQKRGARLTLIDTLEQLLRTLHPLAPFITDEIWMRVRDHAGVTGETVMRSPFPKTEELPADADAEREMSWVRAFILGLRQIRGEMDIAPTRRIDVLLRGPDALDHRYLERNRGLLERLAGIGTLGMLEPGQAGPIAAVALLGTLEILVPMAGLIDPQAEMERLSRRQRKTDNDIDKLQAKLSDQKFAANAPPEVVAKDTQRLAELQLETGQLAAQAARVRALLTK